MLAGRFSDSMSERCDVEVPIRRANSFCLMRALSREYFRANPSPKLLYLDARKPAGGISIGWY